MSQLAPRACSLLGGKAGPWVLFLALLFTYAYFRPDPGWNGDVQMALVRALVEDHTTQIDRVQGDTGDKAFFKGHYYSGKPPGSSLLALPAYAAYFAWLKAKYGVTLAKTQTPKQREIGLYLTTLIAVRIPSALAVTVFFVVTTLLCQDRMKALFATAALGLGSLAFPYSVVLFAHQLTGALLFFAFTLLLFERRRSDSRRPSWRKWPTALAGFVAGYAALTDLSAAPAVLILGAYLLWATREGRQLLLFFAGGLLPAVLLATYNWASFGNVFDVGYHHNADPQAAREMGTGFMGLTYPKFSVAAQIIGGMYRGFLPLSPVLIFSVVGMYQMWRLRSLRPELAVSAVIVLVFLLLNASYFPWDGDASLGPRHIVQMLVFLCVPLSFGLGKHLGLATVLLAVSVVHMLVGATFGPLVSIRYANTLFDWIYPHLFSRAMWAQMPPNLGGVLHLHGPSSLAPVVVVWFVAAALLLPLRLRRTSARSETSARAMPE